MENRPPLPDQSRRIAGCKPGYYRSQLHHDRTTDPELWNPAGPVMPEPEAEEHPTYPSCEADPSVRPCIYTAHEGDTLEMIGHVFMVPLSRLLYYNLRYAKN